MTLKAYDELLCSRHRSEERARLYLVGENLRKRLSRVFGTSSSPEDQTKVNPATGHTERMHRLLILWLDLQRAVTKARSSHDQPDIFPWNSADAQIAELWGSITRPENLSVLAEWLCQSASGESEIWAQQALLECCRRAKNR